jgi:outer membrane protein OmpA-like peptidoglycan-associated protein
MKKIRNIPLNFLIQISQQLSSREDKGSGYVHLISISLLTGWIILWWLTFSQSEKRSLLDMLNGLTGQRTQRFFIFVIVLSISVSSLAAKGGVEIYKFLVPKGELRLQIVDDRGKPMSGLDVDISNESDPNQVGIGLVTDGNGSVIANGLHNGHYKVWILKDSTTNEIESMSGRIIVDDKPTENKWTFTPKQVSVKRFDNINFETDQSDINDYFHPTLSSVANYFATNRGTLFIYGHCDEMGTDDHNFKLGADRSLKVRKLLNSFGITSKRVFLFSYGKNKLIDPGFPLSNAKNRRVEFYLISE